MRVHNVRYCRAVTASGEYAATSARSMRRGFALRTGVCTGASAGSSEGASTASTVTTLATSCSANGRIRRTAPSRSALSRMFCMRLIVVPSDRDARDAAEDGHIGRVAQVALVVHRRIEVLAQERQSRADHEAAEDRSEP